MTSGATIADQSDNQALFKASPNDRRLLGQRYCLFIAYSLFYSASTYAYLQGNLTLVWSVVLNSIAAYISFTNPRSITSRSQFQPPSERLD